MLVLVMEVADLKQEEDDEGGDHQSENKGKRTHSSFFCSIHLSLSIVPSGSKLTNSGSEIAC